METVEMREKINLLQKYLAAMSNGFKNYKINLKSAPPLFFVVNLQMWLISIGY